MLRIPIFLLYDALRSSPGFPDFPRLSSLYIEDSTELLDSPFLTRLYPEMGSLAVSFILHVHDTLVTLHWGRSVPEEATKQITAGHLPSLENLSGHKIRKLIQSHPLKKLRIVSLRPSDFDSDTDGSLLRETSSRLPNLSIFALSTNIRTMSIIRDLSTFTNVVEMWYEEEHDCVSYDEESKNERLYPYELLHVVVPALPKLRELCMTIRSDIGSTSSPVAIKEDVLISSRSLLRVTIQFVAYSVACCRINLSRESLDGKWGYNTLMGLQWQKSFKF
ncbi:hypothetical protein FRB91_010771 [Serendipita sp. 411]|nr:hypothetical protein FRB91_010771 [Serendipita sp. 411]